MARARCAHRDEAAQEAVALLGDLRDVCARGGRQAEAAKRIARLREEHTKKPSLIERFRKAGLTT
jgi:uncharacterized Zn finger protein